MRRFIYSIMVVGLSSGLFFLFMGDNSFKVESYDASPVASLTIPEAPKPAGEQKVKTSSDIDPQKPLSQLPEMVKAIYVTGWSAGKTSSINRLIDLVKKTELNSMVIDIKDYSGYITYDINLPDVAKYKAKEIRIPRINALLKRLHDENIYVIGRLTVFQDPLLSAARPDLAVKNKTTGDLWKDNKGLSWIDPSSKDAWDYNIAIAKDALSRGFDEINFDYIRFPSDGNLAEFQFQFYDETTTYKKDAIREFFRYLRKELAGHKISADLFGYSAINVDDLGIGQIIEYAYESFDYVSPMVYPSHYNKGFLGYEKPSKYPYEVIKYSIDVAIAKLIAYNQGIIVRVLNDLKNTDQAAITEIKLPNTKLRPWLQDFDLGGVPYGAKEVRDQMNALYDSAKRFSCEGETKTLCLSPLNGWMLWDPSNIYTVEALLPE